MGGLPRLPAVRRARGSYARVLPAAPAPEASERAGAAVAAGRLPELEGEGGRPGSGSAGSAGEGRGWGPQAVGDRLRSWAGVKRRSLRQCPPGEGSTHRGP